MKVVGTSAVAREFGATVAAAVGNAVAEATVHGIR